MILHKCYGFLCREVVLRIPYKTIKSYVSRFTYERIKVFTRRKEITTAELIRLAVVEFLNKNEEPLKD